MQKLPPIEVSEICHELSEDNPKSIRQVSGGNIHSAWQIEFENKKFFVKRNGRSKKFLKFEEYCLRKIYPNTNENYLRVPKVITYLDVEDVELLIMEWIDFQNNDQIMLGKGLAEMHLKSHESNPKKFGFPIEGYIGFTNQKRGWSTSWIDCFIDLRINPQLSILQKNFLNSKSKQKIIEKIKSVLRKHKPLNSLIHGDLWSGNAGVDQNGKGVLFDPASWWADCEVDIAMSRLFGGFRNEFYEEYYKVIPLKEGFEKRMIIYNFYHILNHANMFGGSYYQEAENYIKKILDM